ncbi:PREDICTED: uncharacterized protein LOC108516008 [Rhinopithecus bieti]|uniref:uncharacterized protein LOC108516008 n=1 Tax=Rhinopithecus bieti TaxID=61621 RepID=UPI00083BF535|nr:PREDICTED: uncharacterized protein LOC108516008 [Rhinopithecus bieti]
MTHRDSGKGPFRTPLGWRGEPDRGGGLSGCSPGSRPQLSPVGEPAAEMSRPRAREAPEAAPAGDGVFGAGVHTACRTPQSTCARVSACERGRETSRGSGTSARGSRESSSFPASSVSQPPCILASRKEPFGAHLLSLPAKAGGQGQLSLVSRIKQQCSSKADWGEQQQCSMWSCERGALGVLDKHPEAGVSRSPLAAGSLRCLLPGTMACH